MKFGTAYATILRIPRPAPDDRWHLAEMFVSIGGRRIYLWRAVDAEKVALEILVQVRRDKRVAMKLMRKVLRKLGASQKSVVTVKLRSYEAKLGEPGFRGLHETVGRPNNRAENAHQPVRGRERSRDGVKRPESAQRFLSAHAVVYHCFKRQRHLISGQTLRVSETRRSLTGPDWRTATQTV